MTERAEDRPDAPKPPSGSHLIAVLLEISMVNVFIAHRSILGLALAAAYAWFSATWALLLRKEE